jgi:hypothetical protein
LQRELRNNPSNLRIARELFDLDPSNTQSIRKLIVALTAKFNAARPFLERSGNHLRGVVEAKELLVLGVSEPRNEIIGHLEKLYTEHPVTEELSPNNLADLHFRLHIAEDLDFLGAPQATKKVIDACEKLYNLSVKTKRRESAIYYAEKLYAHKAPEAKTKLIIVLRDLFEKDLRKKEYPRAYWCANRLAQLQAEDGQTKINRVVLDSSPTVVEMPLYSPPKKDPWDFSGLMRWMTPNNNSDVS